MATPISKKLRIRENDTLLVKNAPPSFLEDLGPLPGGVHIVTTGTKCDQVHWFVSTKQQLEKEISSVLKLVKEGVIVWVYYPKGSSGMQTDLTRDKGWDCLQKEGDRLTWINLISFNDTWSVFGFRPTTAADKKKETQTKDKEILNWVDPVARTVKVPEDLLAAFRKNKKEAAVFEGLAYSHRKEYVEWIVTAKKEETRASRVTGTIERLSRGWKNPANNR